MEEWLRLQQTIGTQAVWCRAARYGAVWYEGVGRSRMRVGCYVVE